MTDDLLDEATRLADDCRNLDEGRVLRALVELVQQAEAERDAARGKLDKVRQWSDNNLGGAQNAALLAILDD